jgi:hypothetical protein
MKTFQLPVVKISASNYITTRSLTKVYHLSNLKLPLSSDSKKTWKIDKSTYVSFVGSGTCRVKGEMDNNKLIRGFVSIVIVGTSI